MTFKELGATICVPIETRHMKRATISFGQIGANRNYIQDRLPADEAFLKIVWPVLQERIGGTIVNTDALGEAGRAMDIYGGIDWIWSAGTPSAQSRAGYGPLYTGAPAGPPAFCRGLAVRCQWQNFSTFTIRQARDSGADTEHGKRLRQLVQDVDHDELVAGYFVQAYVNPETMSLRRVAMAKMRDIALLLHYGKCGEHYYKQHTPRECFYVIDWDTYQANFGRAIGAPNPYFLRIEAGQ